MHVHKFSLNMKSQSMSSSIYTVLTSLFHSDGLFIFGPDSEGTELSADGLNVLLSFSLARGSVASVIQTLLLLQRHADVTLECAPLLRSVNDVLDEFWRKQGQFVQVGYSVVCFGCAVRTCALQIREANFGTYMYYYMCL